MGNFNFKKVDQKFLKTNLSLNGSKLNGRNEIINKNDPNPTMTINNMQNQFNNFRVKSAQNVNKQRVSGI